VVACREALSYFWPETNTLMKALLTFALLTAAVSCFTTAHCQVSSSAASDRAIVFADSFLASYRNNDLDKYTDLSYPGVVSYYGGNKNFREYVQRVRALNSSSLSNNITIIQLVHDANELQCVIQKTTETTIDGRKAHIITYIIGQSKDEGQSWKFFDVGSNAPRNLVYIMPDMSERLAVPQRQIVFAQDHDSRNM
jgi:hypothetical protein